MKYISIRDFALACLVFGLNAANADVYFVNISPGENYWEWAGHSVLYSSDRSEMLQYVMLKPAGRIDHDSEKVDDTQIIVDLFKSEIPSGYMISGLSALRARVNSEQLESDGLPHWISALKLNLTEEQLIELYSAWDRLKREALKLAPDVLVQPEGTREGFDQLTNNCTTQIRDFLFDSALRDHRDVLEATKPLFSRLNGQRETLRDMLSAHIGLANKILGKLKPIPKTFRSPVTELLSFADGESFFAFLDLFGNAKFPEAYALFSSKSMGIVDNVLEAMFLPFEFQEYLIALGFVDQAQSCVAPNHEALKFITPNNLDSPPAEDGCIHIAKNFDLGNSRQWVSLNRLADPRLSRVR